MRDGVLLTGVNKKERRRWLNDKDCLHYRDWVIPSVLAGFEWDFASGLGYGIGHWTEANRTNILPGELLCTVATDGMALAWMIWYGMDDMTMAGGALEWAVV